MVVIPLGIGVGTIVFFIWYLTLRPGANYGARPTTFSDAAQKSKDARLEKDTEP
jgi:hypothetical protein